MRARIAVAAFVAAALVAGMTPAVAGAVRTRATPPSSGRLLALSDLPAGWSTTFVPPAQVFRGSCLQQARSALEKGWESTGFTDHRATFDEFVTGAAERARWRSLQHNLATCRHFRYQLGKHSLKGTVEALRLPPVGTASSDYTVGVLGNVVFTLVEDVVLFQAKTDLGVLVYIEVGKPDAAAVVTLARTAAAKAEGQPLAAGTPG